ncbi:hypothetical protein ACI2KR_30120 [Pseudomonas luteola]
MNSKNLPKHLSTVNWPKLIETASMQHQMTIAKHKAFYESDLCRRMIADMVKANKGFGCTDIPCCVAELQDRYGWHDLTVETINEFLDVHVHMQYELSPCIHDYDENNPFVHSAYLVGELIVVVMHGQGSLYRVFPVGANPDLHQKLLSSKKDHV